MHILSVVLEVVKYTVPALVVYFLMRQFSAQQYNLAMAERRAKTNKETLALRYQAYERLVLFCERIKLSDLVVRLNSPNMTAPIFKNALLVAVQKEYEHNITQQLYVSQQLWDMIELLKDNTMSIITSSYIEHEKKSNDEFASDLIAKNNILESQIGAKVKSAIRKEVELYFQ